MNQNMNQNTNQNINNSDSPIILASSSPRRIHMMGSHGYQPIIMPADIDESLPTDITMRDAVMYLALKKALWVETQVLHNMNLLGATIIAADTVVYKNGILGKPTDRDDAFRMLSTIKNTSHQVATGVAILKAGMPIRNVFVDVTDVYCKDYTNKEINDYLDTDEPYDKAGSYAIQGEFSKYIHHYDGSLNTVIGFPWELIEPKLHAL